MHWHSFRVVGKFSGAVGKTNFPSFITGETKDLKFEVFSELEL